MDEVFLHLLSNIPTAVVALGILYISHKRFDELKSLILRYERNIDKTCCEE